MESTVNPFATADANMRQYVHCLQWYAGSERVNQQSAIAIYTIHILFTKFIFLLSQTHISLLYIVLFSSMCSLRHYRDCQYIKGSKVLHFSPFFRCRGSVMDATWDFQHNYNIEFSIHPCPSLAIISWGSARTWHWAYQWHWAYPSLWGGRHWSGWYYIGTSLAEHNVYDLEITISYKH